MSDEFHGNPRVWIVATILVPEIVPENICSWILSMIVMILDLWYPQGVDLKADEVRGSETVSPGHPGWKVVYIKWYNPPTVWQLPAPTESASEDGELNLDQLLGPDKGATDGGHQEDPPQAPE